MHRVLLLLILICFASQAEATIIDSINDSATPATTDYESIDWASNGQGWYYTPTFSYTLTGIYTDFGPTVSTLVTPTITVQIQTDRPVNGGTVLGEGTFQADSADGGVLGASFAPVNVVAGQTYFVDFLNDAGMGVNVGYWQYDGDVPTPSGGATINLGTEYYDVIPSTGFADSDTPVGNYYSFFGSDGYPTVLESNAEPILNFDGFIPTPEPSSSRLMVAGAIAALLVASYRRIRGFAFARQGRA